jgi:hypothetical protein
MKKTVTIEIDIDTDCPGVTAAHIPSFNGTKCKVDIRQDIKNIGLGVDSQVIAAYTAHELGHILGYICELPGNLADPRMLSGQMNASELPHQQLVMNSEREAWDLAEEMFKVKQVRQLALRTYEGTNVHRWTRPVFDRDTSITRIERKTS